jgi:type IX secretion system PorP/SprF family membrane protein
MLMKKLLLYTFLLMVGSSAVAQFDLSMSQYMHNRYAINKAFSGSRETLTLFGSFRKKWAGINGSPSGQYFSSHAPLKNKNMALGLEFFNQQYAVSNHTGFSFSYTYRVRTGENERLGFALNGGANYMASNWSGVSRFDEDDVVFNSDESIFNPLFGFGVSWYSDRFFLGLSTPSFIVQNEFATQDTDFDLARASYIATGGYAFKPNAKWMIQPAFMALYDGALEEAIVDVNATIVFNDLIWVGASYKTSEDVVGLLGYQISPQFRFSYSMDYSVGDMSSFNNGTHEISIQYDFGYKINTPNPKFF